MIHRLFTVIMLCLPLLCSAADKVNINTADRATLISVNGIGPSRAEAIIDYREKNGPYGAVEDLAKIRGIGNSFINANKEKLTIE